LDGLFFSFRESKILITFRASWKYDDFGGVSRTNGRSEKVDHFVGFSISGLDVDHLNLIGYENWLE
jgi:hypothetical protein